MTTPIKTQCPHCHAYSDLDNSQLHSADSEIRCTQCQKNYSIADALDDSMNTHSSDKNIQDDMPIVITDNTPKTTSTNASIKEIIAHSNQTQSLNNIKHNPANSPSSNNAQLEALLASDTLIHDDIDIEDYPEVGDNKACDSKISSDDQIEAILASDTLIHDDIDIGDSSDADLDYGSIDDMDKWLNQSDDLTIPLSSTSVESTLSEPHKDLSSSAANDINANINNANDRAWLEELLIEQKEQEKLPQTNGVRADSNLTQLLTNMGVPLKDKSNPDSMRAGPSHLQSRKMPNRVSLTSLLWLIGCIILVLLLFAQFVIFNLNTIIKNPGYASRLQAVCSFAACSLPSADINAFAITDMNHRRSQSNAKGGYSDIKATLNNTHADTQLLPHLKVSVYSANLLIGEFIAAPNDYLLSSQTQLSGGHSKPFMFTVAVPNDQISAVTIDPIY